MSEPGRTRTEDLLRELAPRVLGAVVRRYRDFADAEDAVQEALLAAAATWAVEGEPDNPLAWLITVASRRMAEQHRRDEARRRREDLAASWSVARPEPASGQDDTLILMFMCCHPSLTPASAIPLTLRAVIAAVHDQAASHDDTDWAEILALYGFLERLTGNPVVTLNRAVAAAMAHGPDRGLELLDGLDERLGDHHRLQSVRAHLLEMAGDTTGAIGEFRVAAARTTNLREQHDLTTKAAQLSSERGE